MDPHIAQLYSHRRLLYLGFSKEIFYRRLLYLVFGKKNFFHRRLLCLGFGKKNFYRRLLYLGFGKEILHRRMLSFDALCVLPSRNNGEMNHFISLLSLDQLKMKINDNFRN
ncbi:uncharacterized protein LOC124459845 [Drosophila willistoni]|uniref:uncharacterized protein LOC124459845 n=1 Tax=Drosophila willistoni TaxID=7260 RepID=UPI001F081F7A|nr:uncharacterized protein LOC124459845 [Drosophila willistoni]